MPNPLTTDHYVCKSCGTPNDIAKIMQNDPCTNCGAREFSHTLPAGANARCDFCSTPEVRYSYPARDFKRDIIPGVPSVPLWGSDGWWAACEPCFNFIQRGDRVGLAFRSANLFEKKNGSDVPMKVLAAQIREVQDQFWANRQGPPIEHTEAP